MLMREFVLFLVLLLVALSFNGNGHIGHSVKPRVRLRVIRGTMLQ